jgi:hypothetical protein
VDGLVAPELQVAEAVVLAGSFRGRSMQCPRPAAIDIKDSVPNHLRLETVALDRLVFADRKLRKHPAGQIRKIARSLERFGWVTPIVIDESGLVIAGRARIEAARSA